MIDILYFASLREQLGCEREQLVFDESLASIDKIKQLLADRGGIWTEVFASNVDMLCAVNQQMVTAQSVVEDEDEVAFFPPVTGG